jgi:hypothetical protein
MDSKADYVRIFGVFQSSGFWKEEVWGDAVTIDSGDDVHAFLMCLSSIAEGPKIIVELPEDVVTDKMVYETFADFFTKPPEDQGYVIEPGNKNSGQSLSYGVVGNAIRAVLWIARAAHYEKGTSDTKIFFQCLGSNSSSSQATWLKGLITNVLFMCGSDPAQACLHHLHVFCLQSCDTW